MLFSEFIKLKCICGHESHKTNIKNDYTRDTLYHIVLDMTSDWQVVEVLFYSSAE